MALFHSLRSKDLFDSYIYICVFISYRNESTLSEIKVLLMHKDQVRARQRLSKKKKDTQGGVKHL